MLRGRRGALPDGCDGRTMHESCQFVEKGCATGFHRRLACYVAPHGRYRNER